MGKVLPFRNVKGPRIETPCEICGELIGVGEGYAVIANEEVDGYVCVECFEKSQPVDDTRVMLN